MRKFFERVLKKLNVNGRDLPVFLLSLLLASSIWFLYNMSLRYNDFLQVPIVAHCSIEGHASTSSGTSDVIARCRTTGYNIARIKAFAKRFPVNVDFSRMHSAGGEIFYVTASDLQEYTNVIFGENVSLEYYLTDTLFFRIPYETFKKVPVRPVYNLDFKPQYTVVGDIDVSPDSILVYGEPYRLENLEYVYTSPIKMTAIDSDIHGVTRIETIRGMRFSEETVRYSAMVLRFVEIPSTVQVTARNVPRGKAMSVYPQYVNVKFRCAFPYAGNVADDVEFYVDYKDFIDSRSGKCLIKTDALPGGVIDYSIDTQVVECVVNNL